MSDYSSDVEETEFWLNHLEAGKSRVIALISDIRKGQSVQSQKLLFEKAFDFCASDQAGFNQD